MATIRLRNGSRSPIKAGTLVRVDPNNPKNFIPVDINKIDVIGITSSLVSGGAIGTINLIGSESTPSIIPQNGASAYELAVASGYVGSLSQWLTSLHGSNGASGTNDIGIVIDGGSLVLTPGTKGYRNIPSNFTVTGWTIISDVTGSCVVDIRKTAFDTFPSSSSIAGTDKPTLSNAQKNKSATLSTFLTSLQAGDIIEFKIDSVSIIKKLYLYIHLTSV